MKWILVFFSGAFQLVKAGPSCPGGPIYAPLSGEVTFHEDKIVGWTLSEKAAWVALNVIANSEPEKHISCTPRPHFAPTQQAPQKPLECHMRIADLANGELELFTSSAKTNLGENLALAGNWAGSGGDIVAAHQLALEGSINSSNCGEKVQLNISGNAAMLLYLGIRRLPENSPPGYDEAVSSQPLAFGHGVHIHCRLALAKVLDSAVCYVDISKNGKASRFDFNP